MDNQEAFHRLPKVMSHMEYCSFKNLAEQSLFQFRMYL